WLESVGEPGMAPSAPAGAAAPAAAPRGTGTSKAPESGTAGSSATNDDGGAGTDRPVREANASDVQAWVARFVGSEGPPRIGSRVSTSPELVERASLPERPGTSGQAAGSRPEVTKP